MQEGKRDCDKHAAHLVVPLRACMRKDKSFFTAELMRNVLFSSVRLFAAHCCSDKNATHSIKCTVERSVPNCIDYCLITVTFLFPTCSKPPLHLLRNASVSMQGCRRSQSSQIWIKKAYNLNGLTPQ